MSRHDDDDYDDDDDDRPSRRRRDDDDDDIEDEDDDDDFDRHVDVGESKRMAAGLCGILLGTFGVHKFILGYATEGIILLSITLGGLVIGTVGAVTGMFCCVPFVLMVFYVLPLISSTIGLIEGIIYLTKSDEEFIELYQEGQRTWF
jgi:TM2 domain-containing membrane protein YozV